MIRVGRRRSWLVGSLGAASLVLLGLGPVLMPAARAADGAQVTGKTTFVVQPEKHRVRARADIHIAYDRPATIDGDQVIRYVLTAWSLAVPDEARHVAVTRGASRQPVTIRERDGYDEVRVDLRPDLASGTATDLRVSYDLPDGGARSSSPIRIGRAYLSFYVFAHGDDQATVRIEVPAGFEVQTRGGDIEQSATADGGTTLRTSGSVDDVGWYVVVEGANPSALRTETLEVEIGAEPRTLEVRSWPEDRLWADRVRERISSGLIELHELNGLDWPVDGPLRVTESATSSLNGYAGFYDPGESGVLDEITISEEPDPMVILHEASHAWFNDGLLTGRWISEGLAESYAARALTRLGSTEPTPDPADRESRAAYALSLWGPPQRIDDRASAARERYGYDASRQVIDALVDEIGEARMRDVLRAAADRVIAYAGSTKREKQALVAGFGDWRYFLDLLEQVGGSTQAADLFRTYVASDVELPTLSDHDDAVRRYAALVEQAAGWRPAFALRAPMARWAFDDVDQQLELATSALERRSEVEPLETRLGLDDGGALRAAFEDAELSYEPVVGLADEELGALDAVADAQAVVAAERSPLVSVGLLGSDTSADLEAAAAAYRAGHLEDARTAAGRAVVLIEAADEVGVQRAGLAGGLVVVILLAGAGATVIVRRGRHRGGTVEAYRAPATLAAPTEAVTTEGSSESSVATLAEDEEGT